MEVDFKEQTHLFIKEEDLYQVQSSYTAFFPQRWKKVLFK